QSLPPANFEGPTELQLDKKPAEAAATTTEKQVVTSSQFMRSEQKMEQSSDRKTPYVDAESAETFRQLADEDVPLPFQKDENRQSTLPNAVGDSVAFMAAKRSGLSGQENIGLTNITATSKGPRHTMDDESAETFRLLANEDVALPFLAGEQNIASQEQTEQLAVPVVHSQPVANIVKYVFIISLSLW
ncbi:hypothetical protein AHF37_11684, partial [Paragonimus kellicotti]